MQFRDECLAAKITLLTSLQSGKMEEALEKAEWLHKKHPSDTTIKELKRYINFDNDMHYQSISSNTTGQFCMACKAMHTSLES